MPDRTCIVTRVQKPEEELIRFVLAPDGQVVADLRRKLPGRGAWVSKSQAVVDEAVRRKAFGRAFGETASAAPELGTQIGVLLRADLVQALAMCRKAGLATQGFTKVEEALGKGHMAALVHATEAAPDGTAKLNRLCGPNAAIVDFLARAELDLAFGRENVVHAALAQGGQAQRFVDLARGYALYNGLIFKGLV